MARQKSTAALAAPRKARRSNEQRRLDSDKRLLDAGLRLVAQKGAVGAIEAEGGRSSGHGAGDYLLLQTNVNRPAFRD